MLKEGVLLFNESINPTGGAEILIRSFAQDLDAQGIRVGVCFSRPLKDEFPVTGYLIPEINSFQTEQEAKATIADITSLLKANSYDLVHVHSINNHRLAASLGGRGKSVKTVHDSRAVCPAEFRTKPDGSLCTESVGDNCLPCMSGLGIEPEKAKHKLDRTLLGLEAIKNFSLVFTPSEYIKEQLELNGINPTNILVVPAFIPDRNEKSLSCEDNSVTIESDILFVGRVIPSKGVNELLQAMSMLSPEYKLTIVGDGFFNETARNLTQQFQLSDRVNFVGWVDNDELGDYYKNSKVVAIPSMGPESFSMVGLEAMKYAKAVVGFDSGGINQWLNHEVNGLLVPRGDIRELAEGISFLLENQDVSAEMGRRGQEQFYKNFTQQKHVETVLGYYDMLNQ